jgi:vacuolar-type H+-ATPase subunit C/Vma6
MLDPRNSFVMALLKSEEANIVGRAHVDRLATVGDDADARGILRDTDLGAYLETAAYGGAQQRDQVLWRYLAARIAALDMQPFVPPDARSFGRAYLLKYDVFNLKAALQGLALERTPALLPIGVIAAQHQLEHLAAAVTVGEVTEVLTRAGLARFEPVIRPFQPAASLKSRLAIEVAMEGEYYRELLATAHGLGGGVVLAKACGMMIDLANLSILCRALHFGCGTAAGDQFIPGGYLLETASLQEALSHSLQDVPRRMEDRLYQSIAVAVVDACQDSGSVATMDQVIEQHRLAALRGLLAPQVAPAPVMAWFLIVKEIELRNVSLLLKSIEDGVSLDAIRRHLLW